MTRQYDGSAVILWHVIMVFLKGKKSFTLTVIRAALVFQGPSPAPPPAQAPLRRRGKCRPQPHGSKWQRWDLPASKEPSCQLAPCTQSQGENPMTANTAPALTHQSHQVAGYTPEAPRSPATSPPPQVGAPPGATVPGTGAWMERCWRGDGPGWGRGRAGFIASWLPGTTV